MSKKRMKQTRGTSLRGCNLQEQSLPGSSEGNPTISTVDALDEVLERVRQDLAEAQGSSERFYGGFDVGLSRYLWPLLAKHGVAVTTDIAHSECTLVDTPDIPQSLTMVMVGVAFTHLPSGTMMSYCQTGYSLMPGEAGHHAAYVNAVENALRDKVLLIQPEPLWQQKPAILDIAPWRGGHHTM